MAGGKSLIFLTLWKVCNNLPIASSHTNRSVFMKVICPLFVLPKSYRTLKNFRWWTFLINLSSLSSSKHSFPCFLTVILSIYFIYHLIYLKRQSSSCWPIFHFKWSFDFHYQCKSLGNSERRWIIFQWSEKSKMTTCLTPAQPSLVTQSLNIFVAYQMYYGSWIFNTSPSFWNNHGLHYLEF